MLISCNMNDKEYVLSTCNNKPRAFSKVKCNNLHMLHKFKMAIPYKTIYLTWHINRRFPRKNCMVWIRIKFWIPSINIRFIAFYIEAQIVWSFIFWTGGCQWYPFCKGPWCFSTIWQGLCCLYSLLIPIGSVQKAACAWCSCEVIHGLEVYFKA